MRKLDPRVKLRLVSFIKECDVDGMMKMNLIDIEKKISKLSETYNVYPDQKEIIVLDSQGNSLPVLDITLYQNKIAILIDGLLEENK